MKNLKIILIIIAFFGIGFSIGYFSLKPDNNEQLLIALSLGILIEIGFLMISLFIYLLLDDYFD